MNPAKLSYTAAPKNRNSSLLWTKFKSCNCLEIVQTFGKSRSRRAVKCTCFWTAKKHLKYCLCIKVNSFLRSTKVGIVAHKHRWKMPKFLVNAFWKWSFKTGIAVHPAFKPETGLRWTGMNLCNNPVKRRGEGERGRAGGREREIHKVAWNKVKANRKWAKEASVKLTLLLLFQLKRLSKAF